MRLAQYQFEIKYRKGAENIVADALSRLPEESEINPDKRDDYLDVIIAAVEKEDEELIECYKERENRGENIETSHEIIAAEPSSEIENAYEAHLQEQEVVEDIRWIKELMLKHKDERPKLGKITNKVRKCLFKEYSNLRILDGIVYRSTEDICGFNRMQYVLPKHMVSKVLDKIHKTVYSGHLSILVY